jgi:hypothetical protein
MSNLFNFSLTGSKPLKLAALPNAPTLGIVGTFLMQLCPQKVKAAFTLSRKDLDKVPDETELHPSLSFVPPNPPIAATTKYPTAILKHKFNQTTKPIDKPLLFLKISFLKNIFTHTTAPLLPTAPTLGIGRTLLMPLCPQMVKDAFTLS